MRLFFAVAAGDAIKTAAAEIIERLRPKADARWVDPRDMHVTLRYMGEQPESSVPRWTELMERAAERHGGFELEYGAVGAFDSLEDVRVIWIGIDGGFEALDAIATDVGRDEPRPFSPHLTIGRPRRKHVPHEFTAALKAEKGTGIRQKTEKISLYASRPASFGHAYEIIAEAALRG